MLLDTLRAANPGLDILDIHHQEFRAYGEPVAVPEQDGGTAAIVAALELWAPVPDEGVTYEPSVRGLEECPALAALARLAFGPGDLQTGYCSGRNSRLNGLEYHSSGELIVAGTDLVLLLGLRADLGRDAAGLTYDSGKVRAFLVRAGEAVEIYSGTLHLAPCRARIGGFRAAIVLPRGTNLPFEGAAGLPDGRPFAAAAQGPAAGPARGAPNTGTPTAPAAPSPGAGVPPAAPIDMNRDTIAWYPPFKRNKWIIAHPERKILTDQGVYPGIRGPNVEVIPVAGEP